MTALVKRLKEQDERHSIIPDSAGEELQEGEGLDCTITTPRRITYWAWAQSVPDRHPARVPPGGASVQLKVERAR